MESPDTPWAKRHDERLKKRFEEPPSRGAVFFLEFLKGKGIGGGRLVDIGCGNGRNAIFFANEGFEVHAVDKSDEVLKDMDLHGVMPHCHSITDYWFFEDGFFDIAMDCFCYSEQADAGRKSFYRDQLSRVLKDGGYYLLCVEESSGQALSGEFAGFATLSSLSFEDTVNGKKKKALAIIMQKKS